MLSNFFHNIFTDSEFSMVNSKYLVWYLGRILFDKEQPTVLRFEHITSYYAREIKAF